MAAAQRAVDLAPTHAIGYYALAFTHFFRKDKAGFRAAVEQAMALNPMDGSVMGLLGLLVHHSRRDRPGHADGRKRLCSSIPTIRPCFALQPF